MCCGFMLTFAENLVTELSLFTPFTPSLVHIVGKCQGKVFEDREVSFLMQEGKLQTVMD